MLSTCMHVCCAGSVVAVPVRASRSLTVKRIAGALLRRAGWLAPKLTCNFLLNSLRIGNCKNASHQCGSCCQKCSAAQRQLDALRSAASSLQWSSSVCSTA